MTSSPSNKLLLLSSTSSLSSASASSATSNSQLQLTTSTTNDTYPRITVKSRPGALIVRETEKILDEKVIQRTEEISCPITGESKLQTVEYIEKLIETEVETCQEKIVSLELENVERFDPSNTKRVMATTRTTTTSSRTIPGADEEEEEYEKEHNEEQESEEESDDSEDDDDDDENMDSDKEHSIITIQSNNDVTDFTINSNSFLKNNPGYNLVQTTTATNTTYPTGDASAIGNSSVPLQTIVEVINPILCGDGTANNITIGRSNDDFSYQSYDGEQYQQQDYQRGYDDDDEYEVVQRRRLNGGGRSSGGFELSINDKMKNVLKELKSNERVRRSLSRSMEDEELGSEEEEDEDEQDDVVDYTAGGGDVREAHPGEEDADETYQSCASYEERKGSNGTVFIVRERLINDFYEHEQIANPEQVPEDDDDDDEGEEDVDEEPQMVESRTTKNLYEKNMEFVDNCKIYTNPNVVEETYTYLDNRTNVDIHKEAAVPADATIINSSTTTYTTVTPNSKYNKDNIKLDLNLSDRDAVVTATDEPELCEAAGVADDVAEDDAADVDAETPTTPTANSNNNNSNLSSNTNSNNNTSNNNKKKKRKGKNKKK